MGEREAWMDHGEAVEVRVAELEALLLTARSNSAGWRSRYEHERERVAELERNPWQERAEAAEALSDELAAALRDLTHEETCNHAWCIAGRTALESYDAWKGKDLDDA